ncbi:MAG: NAD(P)H-hydrate dehydratase [Candidatus Aminicenantes bacterium]|nr:NAD(P)H-hydrate dehydratase [Candidatus Aminicenantes bacterium]
MKVLTSQQMRDIDRRAIEELGIIGPILMENAGIQIVQAMRQRLPDLKNEIITIVAGKGNNGGDGFVVARHLFNQGCRIKVLLLGRKTDLKGDAALNAHIAEKMGLPLFEITTEKQWVSHKSKLLRSTVVLDAIFGTGLSKPVQGLFKTVIESINKLEAFIIAVDIPSGLSSDAFEPIGPCVKADLTVTLAAPKVAHIFPPAENFVGELVVADISIPPFLFEEKSLKLDFVEKDLIAPSFSKRRKDTHKGTFGHLFVLSGSLGKTGAAALAGKAALKMGAGLVTVGTPKSCLSLVARSMIELMTVPLPETPDKSLSKEALDLSLSLLEGKDACLIGPGISTHESTARFVKALIPQVRVPLVLDADALNILSPFPEILKTLKIPVILTPHPGEFARLLDCSTRDVLRNKLELSSRFAQDYNVYLVLKGYRTLTATPDGKIFINPTGNPGMATAGSGDVLSGMLAAMIIQEEEILPAVLAAVYVHGLSGDIAAQRRGEKSLTALDIIRDISSAIKTIIGSRLS